jgi:hypothetical protein
MMMEDEIYFGSVQCRLERTNGQSYSLSSSTLQQQSKSEEIVQQVNQYLNPFVEDDIEVIMPAVPGLPFIVNKSSNNLPEIFQQPLIKNENGSIISVQSGIRSALVKDTTSGKWYRLKGCGNNYDEFPFHNVDHFEQYKHCMNIRGCSFEVTCFRELYYANKVNEILIKNGIPTGNVPVGWFEYNRENDKIKSVKRLCAIFETPGDKRLNDHAISGLEVLLEHAVFDSNSLLQAVPKERLNPENSDKIDSSWWYMILQGATMDSIYADIYHFPVTIRSLDKPDSLPEKYHHIWDECNSIIQNYLQNNNNVNSTGSLFSYLYWRFGREAGAVQRLLTEHQISWGTYKDLLGDHCNAHPNNLVVLPEGTSNTHFLAPVDFDMAFDKDEFTREESLFTEWIQSEPQALAMEIAGAGNNSGVKAMHEYSDEKLDNLRWALRDTMLNGFYSAFQGEKDEHPVLPETHHAANALLKLALLVTDQNIA